MPKFRVTLEQTRFESAKVEVEAEDALDAQEIALSKAGDLDWIPDQVDEDSTFVAQVDQIG